MFYKQNNNLASTELDEEICIFDPIEGNYLNLNSTGSEIWKLLENESNLEHVIEKLIEKYQIDYEICRKEVIDFLNSAVKSKIIVKSD